MKMQRIFGSLVLCKADMVPSVELRTGVASSGGRSQGAEKWWDWSRDEVVNRINKYRCMHGAPPLQYSIALENKAGDYLVKEDPEKVPGQVQKQEPRPSVRGFGEDPEDYAELGQSVANKPDYVTLTSPTNLTMTKRNIALSIIDSWYDQKRFTKDETGATSDNCNRRCEDYTQMVWLSATHVGCYELYQISDTPDALSFVCNYGPLGNLPGEYDNNVFAKPTDKVYAKLSPEKLEDRCEKDVKFMQKWDSKPHKVTISYMPAKAPPATGLAASQQTGEDFCDNIQKYRLIDATREDFPTIQPGNEGLALVGLDENDEPCAKETYEVGKFKEKAQWEYQIRGMFSKDQGTKSCLWGSGGGNLMVSLAEDEVAPENCASDNYFSDAHDKDVFGSYWRFVQTTDNNAALCMGEPPVREDGKTKYVIHAPELKVIDGDQGCSYKWLIDTFRTHTQQSDLQQQATVPGEKLSCQKCLHRSGKNSGNFACFLETNPDDKGEYHDQCVLAPTKRDCYAQGFEKNPKGQPWVGDQYLAHWCSQKYPTCRGDDWKGNQNDHPGRRPCHDGCRPDICEKKKNEHPALAIDHCYTQEQLDKNDLASPHGCDYGTPSNTCGLDQDGVCVYSETSSMVTV